MQKAVHQAPAVLHQVWSLGALVDQLASKIWLGTLASFLYPERVGFPFLCPCNLHPEWNTCSGEQQLHRHCTCQLQEMGLQVLCKTRCMPLCFLLCSPWAATLPVPTGFWPAVLTHTQQESQERQGLLQPHPCVPPSFALLYHIRLASLRLAAREERTHRLFKFSQERGPRFFSQNCVQQWTEQCWGDSLFPVKPASSQERHRTHMIK